MAPQFAYVVIPPGTTSEDLRRDRPMLWGAIVTAASYHDPLRQEVLGWKMMEEFSERLLVKAEKSLDILQALIVHLTWYVVLSLLYMDCWSHGLLIWRTAKMRYLSYK